MVCLVGYVWLGRFGLVGLVGQVKWGIFGLVSLVGRFSLVGLEGVSIHQHLVVNKLCSGKKRSGEKKTCLRVSETDEQINDILCSVARGCPL